jgi:hypothetical protein
VVFKLIVFEGLDEFNAIMDVSFGNITAGRITDNSIVIANNSLKEEIRFFKAPPITEFSAIGARRELKL